MNQIQKRVTDERIREFLHDYCGITEIPCYSWFTQIIGLIEPHSFNERSIKWALSLVGDQTERSTTSFDEKTVCVTEKTKKHAKPLHIVSGHLAELGITLGQKAVNAKSNFSSSC